MKFQSFNIFCLLALLFVSGCSTNKNTSATRAIQSLNTRYNVHFNGKVSYDEALKAITLAGQDDFGQLIPMYPISKHENASAGKGQLDRTIEKCRKAIKTRSIKTKPKYSRRRASQKNYREYMSREEYNPFMHEVWLLLAKAEFHKADFLGAVGTFNYIARHFKENEDLVMTCQLWVIRSYAEMGWIYEAEEMMQKLDPKKLQGDNVALYTAFQADLLLKKKQYREAIPFLEMAYDKEKDKNLKRRFSFLLAQLYQHTGDKKKAYDTYSSLLKKSPPYAMAFNARINRASLFLGNMKDTRRELKRMARNFNNRDYLDQVYYALGKTYLHEKDTLKALSYFEEAVENSTRNGMDKAMVLVDMGDLYYVKQQYVEAQPCYDEASKILSVEFPDYPRIEKRAEVLAELVVQHEIVMLQDSLQRLSAKSPEERLKSIQAYIAQKELEEKLAAEKEEKMQLRREENQAMAGQAGPQVIGGNLQGAWYFYNPGLVRSGQTEFQSRWGRRKLEDNWRRANKTAVLFEEEDLAAAQDSVDVMPGDSILLDEDGNPLEKIAMQEEEDILDEKNPEFYLRQIPETEEQIEHSNLLWSEALFSMGKIYKDKLEDYSLSLKTFDEYMERFASYELVPEALYQSYLILIKLGQEAEAEQYRMRLIENYPDVQYAELLSQPGFIETKQRMFEEQDSLYRMVYEAFNRNEFPEVLHMVDEISQQYPLSSLMPKFLFLKALSIGKTQDQDIFEETLNQLIDAYPESDVSSISKDIIALLMQGREAQHGTMHGSILARREVDMGIDEAEEGDVGLSFKPDREALHRIVLISPQPEEALYDLQFQLAIFNFSRFLLEDFELNISKIDDSRNALSVYEFDDYEDAAWYLSAVSEDEEIGKLMQQLQVFPLVISEHNFALTRSGLTIEDYLTYKAEIGSEPEEETED
ncbi:MAG TPA: tetratricopeptide repeat protein [Paludibacter sp.]|nr:tetratricopeptide repeat protein [Paludibacter sp.]